jgi:hypothetical protein
MGRSLAAFWTTAVNGESSTDYIKILLLFLFLFLIMAFLCGATITIRTKWFTITIRKPRKQRKQL